MSLLQGSGLALTGLRGEGSGFTMEAAGVARPSGVPTPSSTLRAPLPHAGPASVVCGENSLEGSPCPGTCPTGQTQASICPIRSASLLDSNCQQKAFSDMHILIRRAIF